MCSFDLTGSGSEDEQEDSRAGEAERRAQTDRTGAVLSLTVCLSDQRLAVAAQMTACTPQHYTTQTALQEQQSRLLGSTKFHIFVIVITKFLLTKTMVNGWFRNHSDRGLSSKWGVNVNHPLVCVMWSWQWLGALCVTSDLRNLSMFFSLWKVCSDYFCIWFILQIK